MSEARQLTQAERCSLFLLDRKQNELIAKVFDGDISDKPGKSEVCILFDRMTDRAQMETLDKLHTFIAVVKGPSSFIDTFSYFLS